MTHINDLLSSLKIDDIGAIDQNDIVPTVIRHFMSHEDCDGVMFEITITKDITNIFLLDLNTLEKTSDNFYKFKFDLSSLYVDIIQCIECEGVKALVSLHGVLCNLNTTVLSYASMYSTKEVICYIPDKNPPNELKLKFKCYLLNNNIRKKSRESLLETDTHKYINGMCIGKK